MKGDKGDSPTEEDLLKLIKPLIPEPIKGDVGRTPTEKEILALIEPLVPKIENGKTPTKKELLDIIEPLIPTLDTQEIVTKATERAVLATKKLIPDIKDIEQNLPQLGEEIRDGLELLEKNERLDISAIKGLDDYDEISGLARQPKSENIYSGGGTTVFSNLLDVPNSYTGQAGKSVSVKGDETGLEFTANLATDEKVKYDAGDPTAGYLSAKVVAGTGITLSEGTGADENKLKITNSLDLSAYVPYTGATSNVDLGDNRIILSSVTQPKITVSDTAPASPSVNDLWVDIS